MEHTVIRAALGAILWVCGVTLSADEIRVAVASNFTVVLQELVGRFEQKTGHEVIVSPGSTGKHYAQIRHGAPFEVFLAADVERPQRLEQEGLAMRGSRFTYAIGKLVLWSPDPARVDGTGDVLREGDFRYLAMANERLAPYGMAAEQVMRARGVWKSLRGRIVRGENVSQTFQFVKSGNAELGFVAYSQIKQPDKGFEGSYWMPPHSLYSPIEQQAVLLKDNAAARAFLAFLKGPTAQAIIRNYGYDTAAAQIVEN